MVDAAMAGSSRLATSGCLPLQLTVRSRTVHAIGTNRRLRVRALTDPSVAISAPAHTACRVFGLRLHCDQERRQHPHHACGGPPARVHPRQDARADRTTSTYHMWKPGGVGKKGSGSV